MASGESQKHLLSLIRNFASEKSQEELRVSDRKKRLLELQNDLNVANADLDGAKRSREMVEQELRGSQVQLSMIGASIHAQEARISLLQEEILKLRSDLDTLKSEVRFMRDEFVNSMCELNKKIRNTKLLDMQGFLKGLEDNITCLSTQMHELEAEYEKERHNRDKVCEQLAHVERRWFLVTAIMEETKQLQELAKQTSELEKVYASLGEDLQKKCTCPGCGSNNIEDGGN
nr:PREDICTED: tropomyosin [Musa acuminata subsp. malaccensis]